jgi:hypothetical protein
VAGAAGPKGDTGSAGIDAIPLRADIDNTGSRAGGNATKSTRVEEGLTRVHFARSAAGCTYVATLARVATDPEPPAGRITVAEDAGTILVRTYDASGVPQTYGFHLIVAC